MSKDPQAVNNDIAKQVRIQVYTTEEKHRAFKMMCAGDGVKMTDKVDELITAYLKEKGITIE
ncbi:plasmid partition protein ParG [Escherichia coli]|uniref:plasmid partition protein ParG n=1 Tax=Escherichia coli TaxID=562 RepID=UPI0038B36170